MKRVLSTLFIIAIGIVFWLILKKPLDTDVLRNELPPAQTTGIVKEVNGNGFFIKVISSDLEDIRVDEVLYINLSKANKDTDPSFSNNEKTELLKRLHTGKEISAMTPITYQIENSNLYITVLSNVRIK